MSEIRYHKSLIYKIFHSFTQKDSEKTSSLGEIIEELHDIGFSILMFLLSMPIAIPLPYPPGSTAIFGIPLLILSIQLTMGYKEIHLPKMITNYQVSNKRIKMLGEKALIIFPKVEKAIDIIVNMLNFVATILRWPVIWVLYIIKKKFRIRKRELPVSIWLNVTERLIGIMSILCSICISSPIPFTHSLPAWGIAIMSLGSFRRDGNVIFLGFIVSMVGIWISYEFIMMAINLIYMI